MEKRTNPGVSLNRDGNIAVLHSVVSVEDLIWIHIGSNGQLLIQSPFLFSPSGYMNLDQIWTNFVHHFRWKDSLVRTEVINIILVVVFVCILLSFVLPNFLLRRGLLCCRSRRRRRTIVESHVLTEKDDFGSAERMTEQLRKFEFSRNKLVFIRDIGQGEFGRVAQAKAMDLQPQQSPSDQLDSAVETVDIEANANQCRPSSRQETVESFDYSIVAVKMLKPNELRKDVKLCMLREAFVMSRLSHKNLLGLLGVCDAGQNNMYMLVEYMAKGDLNSFLRFRCPYTNPTNRSQEQDDQSLQSMLLGFAVQIACGMEYMCSQRLVHRDLATRNCLVDENLIIKISDFGMAMPVMVKHPMECLNASIQKSVKQSPIWNPDKRNVNGTGSGGDGQTSNEPTPEQQELLENEKLPIRWMPLEAILFQWFTSASDVWSFGILMWELFTFAQLPYVEIKSNKEVIQFVLSGKRLSTPTLCPDTVRILMNNCWLLEPKNRPTFAIIRARLEFIHRNLSRLNRRRFLCFNY